MISPQNIATGAAMTGMQRHKGDILARTSKHGLILTFLLGLLVLAQQYLVAYRSQVKSLASLDSLTTLRPASVYQDSRMSPTASSTM